MRDDPDHPLTARRTASQGVVTNHVAVIGAGFSGALAAINLVRHDGPRATLIERNSDAGAGLAFGAAHSTHLLNVRATNMSAFPDDPGHFVRWLGARGIGNAAQAFVPRLTYGDYLRELLDAAVRQSPDRLTIMRGDVVDIARGKGAYLTLGDGRLVRADAAVLAVGNLSPHPPAGIDPDTLAPGRYASDCWAATATDGLGPDDTVLILGSGLTMVDVVLLLDAKGFQGRIVALSRRGLVPHAHSDSIPPWIPITQRPATIGSHTVRQLRIRSDGVGWRATVDELRRFTQDMWRAASPAARARFIRHLRPWWDVHRHRLAPVVAARIAQMRETGRLSIIAGKTGSATEEDNGVVVTWRPRGSDAWQRLEVQRIINCTGPQGDLLRTDEPVLRTLVERGVIRPDSARLGIDVDSQLRTVAGDGISNDWLFALGPMTRGACWESVAVPDIRTQAWTLARRLSNAHWVAEGL